MLYPSRPRVSLNLSPLWCFCFFPANTLAFSNAKNTQMFSKANVYSYESVQLLKVKTRKHKQLRPQYPDDVLPPSYPQHLVQTFQFCWALKCASSYRSPLYGNREELVSTPIQNRKAEVSYTHEVLQKFFILLLPWQVIEDYFCSCTIGSPWVMPQIEDVKLPVSNETTGLKHHLTTKSWEGDETYNILSETKAQSCLTLTSC